MENHGVVIWSLSYTRLKVSTGGNQVVSERCKNENILLVPREVNFIILESREKKDWGMLFWIKAFKNISLKSVRVELSK